MQTALLILSHVPSYVWLILAAIVALGLLQSRDQLMARARLLILPLVWLAYGAWGVESAFGLQAAPLLAWGLGLAAGVLLVLRSGWPAGARFDAASQRFFVPGSWLPLGLMLALFVGKFALGMGLALRPTLAQHLPVALAFSALFGALGGAFLGRSRGILRRAPAAQAAQTAAPL